MKTKIFLFLLLISILIIPAFPSIAQEGLQLKINSIIKNQENVPEEETLNKLFEIHLEYFLAGNPEMATFFGKQGYNDKWTDWSAEAINKRKKSHKLFANAINNINRANLNEKARLNYDLFNKNIEEQIKGAQFKDELMPVNQLGGYQQMIPQVLAIMPTNNKKDYEDMISRLEKIPVLIDQLIHLMDQGLKESITPPKVTLRDIPQQVDNLITDDPINSPLLMAFNNFPDDITEDAGNGLKSKARQLVAEEIYPALKKLKRYLSETYIPQARESIALSDMPDGSDWYAYKVASFTTTGLSAKEIHEIGLGEVKRIREEMDKVIQSTGFQGSFEEFTDFLRTDPQFFYNSPEALLTAYRDIAKRVDPELIKVIGKLPRLPYGVKPVPSYAEKSQTTAYYEPGSPEIGRPGYFYANTYDLKSRPKWEMEALTIHEAVPGHHLQIALSQELENVPEFRKLSLYTAFVEGWGLYSESLGEVMGFYRDPYSKFGQLTYEMWRAIRLVVDTGMHSLGWTREQAIDYFKKNSAKTEHDITVEIDRYIVWPGQALAYKIGELKIKELRTKALAELGEKFDLRQFHDTILENGALPLDILEIHVNTWIEGQKGS